MIRAAFFDAVGTVIHPVGDILQVYAEAGTRAGLATDRAAVRERFLVAYRAEEEWDAADQWATSEAREIARWKAVVAAALPGSGEATFDELYAHYARPDAWACAGDTAATLEALAARGLTLGLASNYDARLLSVAAGRPELARLVTNVVVSSLVGVRKPGLEFFDAVVAAAGCDPAEILFVGDDFGNDYAGATAAGMVPVLLDPAGKLPDVPRRITSLAGLLELPEIKSLSR